MTYRITYIDENAGWNNTFYQTFKEFFNVETIKITPEVKLESIIDLIRQDLCDIIIVDYMLSEEWNVDYNGNKVVELIRNTYPHFPIIMLTSFATEAFDEMDETHIVYRKKNILDEPKVEDIEFFIEKIKSHIESYNRKKKVTEEEILMLVHKRNEEWLNIDEEERLTKLSILMDELDPEWKILPTQFLQKETLTKLYTFVKETEEVLAELRSLSNLNK